MNESQDLFPIFSVSLISGMIKSHICIYLYQLWGGKSNILTRELVDEQKLLKIFPL